MVSLFGNAKGYSISIKPLKQYVVVEGTKRADFDAAAGPFASLPLMSVPVQLLTELGAPTTKKVVDAGGKVTAAKFPVFTVVEGVKAEERSGVKGKRVSGRGALPGGEMMGIDEVVAASAWFADDTGLLGEVSYDLTEMLKKMMGGADAEGAPKIEAASLVLAHDEVKLDPKVDAAAVAFKAADGYKKVDKFSMEEGGEGDDGEAAQKALIGKPAPVVKAKDLDGKAVALADHKGKVVVLDFWATWCPPCVQSIPSVQGLWDGFKEKGVVVIGVNQDQEESVEKVKKFIAEKGVTYPQYADFVGELGELFHVTGIPCMVFIDKEGVVRDIHVGFTPGDEAGMKAKVEKLLKGEKLVEPAAPTQPAATPGEKPGDKPAEKK
jgi:peroxiredoxin